VQPSQKGDGERDPRATQGLTEGWSNITRWTSGGGARRLGPVPGVCFFWPVL